MQSNKLIKTIIIAFIIGISTTACASGPSRSFHYSESNRTGSVSITVHEGRRPHSHTRRHHYHPHHYHVPPRHHSRPLHHYTPTKRLGVIEVQRRTFTGRPSHFRNQYYEGPNPYGPPHFCILKTATREYGSTYRVVFERRYCGPY